LREVVGQILLDAEAVVDSFDAERDGEAALADVGPPNVVGPRHVGAGGERRSLAALDAAGPRSLTPRYS
jgi:hypothetical protein